MSDYVGIDYGMGVSNRDPETGIHYGVISQHTPSQWIWDDFEGDYGPAQITCTNCGTEFSDDDAGAGDTVVCPNCDESLVVEDDSWPEEAISQVYKGGGGYKIDYSESLCCFYVCGSPFYTYAKYCSPCAPGALDLDSPIENGPRAYCLGVDFFDHGKAPYNIYSIATNELVYKVEEVDENS